VNKINNFIENKPTKIELIEVDYFGIGESLSAISTNIRTIVVGELVDNLDCTITVPITVSQTLPVDIVVIPYRVLIGALGTIYEEFNPNPPITATLSGSSITFNYSQLPFNVFGYVFKFYVNNQNVFNQLFSTFTPVIFLDAACVIPPTVPSSITITTVRDLGADPNAFFAGQRIYEITYTVVGLDVDQNYVLLTEAYEPNVFNFALFEWVGRGNFNKTQGDTTQTITSFQPQKIRVKILGVTSNEFIL